MILLTILNKNNNLFFRAKTNGLYSVSIYNIEKILLYNRIGL